MDNKGKTSNCVDTDVLLPDKLNTFFAHFEDNIGPPKRPATKDCGLSFSVADVSKTFKCVNHRKAAGPHAIYSRVLRACADQLAGVFTDIFNLSLSQSVLTCFKRSTIVPVPKNAKVTELNNYCPIALTSVIMKFFERPVKYYIISTLPDTLDPPEGGAVCPTHHWGKTTCPPGHLQHRMSQDGHHNFSNKCLQTDYFTYNSLYHNSSGAEVYIH
jgi:hypothetical protein